MNTVGIHNQSTREQWIQHALRCIPAGWRLLDAGAGERPFRDYCTHLVYVSQDFAKYDGQGNSAGLHTGTWDNSGLDIVSDITAVPEPAASFDAILCTEVLEHVPDPVAAIYEFSRLLRPGGLLIVTAPFCSLTHFAPFHFSTGFSEFFYREILGRAGFDIVEMQRNGNYFEYLGQELRRISVVAERYAGVRPARWEQLAIRILLRMLARLSRRDAGSEELLCFGYHVRARRSGVEP